MLSPAHWMWNYFSWPSWGRPARPSTLIKRTTLDLRKPLGGRVSKAPSPQRRPPLQSPSRSPGGSQRPAKFNPDLFKRDGRRVDNGAALIPQHVDVGRAQRFPPLPNNRSKGLENIRNTCFRSSALQCLLHVPRFYRFLGKVHKDCKKRTHECLPCALQNLAHCYWNDTFISQRHELLGPTRANRQFNRACQVCLPVDQVDLADDFKNNKQGDPYDFLIYLWNQMQSVESTEDEISPWDLFGIGRDVKVTCQECGASEEDDERHGMGLGFDVSIRSLPRGNDLEDYLREYLRTERRSRCKSFRCRSRYGMTGEGTVHDVKCAITELPEVLVVRLQRFRHDRTQRGQWVLRKEEREVSFGEYLNLGRYTPEGFDEMYRLDGVVAHRGDRLDGGHYIAVVRTAEGFDYDTVNDNNAIEHRSDGDIEAMLSPKSRNTRFLPYVLIYSKMQEDYLSA